MRAATRIGLALLAMAGLAYPVHAAPPRVPRPDHHLRVVSPDGRVERDSFSLVVEAPQVSVVPGQDGYAEVRAEGFDVRQTRAGYPNLPERVILLAIPPEATPRLVVRPKGQMRRLAARPRPVPRSVPAESEAPDALEGPAEIEQRLSSLPEVPTIEVPALEREVYEGSAPWPPAPAWLGRIGVLRDQRYVELHLAPVRFEGAAGSLRVEPEMEITVYFDGAARASGVEAGASRFESVYRSAFANYAQGRQFRLGRDEAVMGSGEPPQGTSVLSSIGPIRRLVVHQDGMVRLDYSYFQTQAPEFLTYNPNNWRLVGRGSAVPLQIQGGGNPALLEPGEWIQFYGERADDEPESVLHWQGDIDQEWLYEAQDFTDDNVYFLTVDSLAQPPMSTRDATPTGATPAATHTAVAHVETDDHFWPISGEVWFWLPPLTLSASSQTKTVPLPGLASGTAPIDVRARFRGFSSCLNVDPDHITKVSLKDFPGNQTLVLPADPDNVGNQNVAEFDGAVLFTQEFGWVHSGGAVVTDPLQVALQVAGTPPCTSNDVLPDWVEIAYQKTFAAQSDALSFDWPDGDAEFQITGFTTSSPQIYEVTNLLPGGPLHDAIRLTGATVTPSGPNFTVRFHIADDPSLPGTGIARHFVVAGSAAVTAPAATDFKADRVSTLISDTSQADLIAIVHPDLVSSHCSTGGNSCSYDVDCTGGAADRCEVDAGSQFGLLLAHREAQDVATRVVRIGDIYDEFGAGMPGPNAVKNFLSWVWSEVGSGGWDGPAPSFVLLVGDGSYDFKAGTANGSFVPTPLMIKEGNPRLPYYSADNWLAAVSGGDSMSEMLVGRIAVRTLAEAEAVFQKIRTYEQTPAIGTWSSTGLLISDRGKIYPGQTSPDPQENAGFEAINDIAVGWMADTPYTTVRLRYWSDYASTCSAPLWNCKASAIRTDIKALVNGTGKACALSLHKCSVNADCTLGAGDTCQSIDGAALVQFQGHGNFDLWSDDKIFCGNNFSGSCTPDDTEGLFNGGRVPWLMVNNCLSGGFHSTSVKSLGEQWLRRGTGGAVAVFAPSGLGYMFLGQAVTNTVWSDLFGPQKIRDLATPVMDSLVLLCATGGQTPEACEFYTLLGDPATLLQLESVDPASNLAAQASTGPVPQVGLSWSPSLQPGVGYDIYRATQLNLPYVKVNSSPVSGTSYQDTAVSLTQTYYYYVVAVSAGFESAWSNFNSDCSAGSPSDCAKATPLNLVAPNTPGAPVVVDPETGGKLIVFWTPNPEPDVAGYEVHYGTTPAMTEPFQLGGPTGTLAIAGLADGTTYYFAVRAVNTSGTHSALSGIGTGVPSQVLGVKAPGFISSLRLTKSGTNAVLTWGAVTADIYGKAESVAHYEVYRGTTVTFVPGPATLLGTTTAPTFTDVGALGSSTPYHYLVRAIDVDGNPGGLGQELPGGIRELQIGRVASGDLVFSWPPVTLDFSGEPTVITRYDLYSADHPFTRADIRDGLISLVGSVTGPTLVLVPPVENRYYSVLAVDARGNKSPF